MMPDDSGIVDTGTPDRAEHFPNVALALALLTDKEREVALIRLAANLNNGSEHFDHSDAPGAYSWLCLACRTERRGPYYVDARTMGLGPHSADPERTRDDDR